jgi:hypothetical protein
MEFGLLPNQRSNWVGSEDKHPMGDGSIYMFADIKDAHEWARFMQDEFKEKVSLVYISEVFPPDTVEFDDSDCPVLSEKCKGVRLRTRKMVPREKIIPLHMPVEVVG